MKNRPAAGTEILERTLPAPVLHKKNIRSGGDRIVSQREASRRCHVTPPALSYLIKTNKVRTYAHPSNGMRKMVDVQEVRRALSMSPVDLTRERYPDLDLLSARDAELRYGLSRMTVFRWSRNGTLKRYPVIGGKPDWYLVSGNELERVLIAKDRY